MKNVIVVIGSGQIGQAIARWVGVGKRVLLADMRPDNANAAAEVMGNAGYEVSVATVDASSRHSVQALVDRAKEIGDVTGLIHAAGVPEPGLPGNDPQSRSVWHCTRSGRVWQSHCAWWRWCRYRVAVRASPAPITVEQNKALATTPVEELLSLPFLQPDEMTDSLHAYQISKRGNSLRVMAEAVRWGKRGARVNTISPGIIITPLAKDELAGPRGEGYRRMIEESAAGRARTPDEMGTVAALLMGADGGFITGSDILMDGGVTAAYWFADLAG